MLPVARLPGSSNSQPNGQRASQPASQWSSQKASKLTHNKLDQIDFNWDFKPIQQSINYLFLATNERNHFHLHLFHLRPFVVFLDVVFRGCCCCCWAVQANNNNNNNKLTATEINNSLKWTTQQQQQQKQRDDTQTDGAPSWQCCAIIPTIATHSTGSFTDLMCGSLSFLV